VYEFKGEDDPEYQKVFRWKLILTPFEYLMLRANADYSYSTEFIEEVDKEAERIALVRELVTSKPNLIRYHDKYNTSTDNFIEEVDKEEERISLEREILTSKPNLIRYTDKYNTSTYNFINNLALYDPNNIEVAHSGEPLITGFFTIDEIEGLPSQLTNENLMFLEGVFNLYLNGIETFTPEVLYRYSIGAHKVGEHAVRVTDQQKERAIASVERMATIRQELDLTPYIAKYGSKEAKAYLKEEPEGAYIIKSYMLPVEEVTEKVQGV